MSKRSGCRLGNKDCHQIGCDCFNADRTVRRLEHIPTHVLVQLAKGVPSQCKRILRELFIRVTKEQSDAKNIDNSRDHQDSQMVMENLFKAIGEVCWTDYSDLPTKDRLDWSWRAMTTRERSAMLCALLDDTI